MGETGCGKTRLVNFFSLLHQRTLKKNLIHVKIHGGTTAKVIEEKLKEAVKLSKENFKQIQASENNGNPNPISVILFFDEANTTEEIGLIKEIMCDKTINGEKIDLSYGLKIIAAVNPYRKHSKEMIEKLENAGLGFYISSSESKDKLGHIPMRQLVYRVQPLPSSFLPLVWDFGQLDKGVENVYVKQMICKAIIEMKFCKNSTEQTEITIEDKDKIDVLCKLLSNSQHFMR
jgi:E3 ubiquitin-protein ligase RNF213